MTKEVNEEIKNLMEAKNMGRWTPGEYKVRRKYLTQKKANIRAGKF